MVDVLQFYLDESGTRRPDHKPGKKAEHENDYFGLGGILIKESDEPKARRLHEEFLERWGLTYPLHSVEIRGHNKNFLWLEKETEERRNEFFEALNGLMKDMPVIGLACVIDRPGYNARYREKYGDKRWLLCKTAFSVAVERAAKYAISVQCRLRVMPERCNKKDDARLKRYYADLATAGMPFATNTSEKYAPLTAEQFRETLYEFLPKNKTSPMAQVADLYLWPICMGGYHRSNRSYRWLVENGKLIECLIPESDWPTRATKYSCFELVTPKP